MPEGSNRSRHLLWVDYILLYCTTGDRQDDTRWDNGYASEFFWCNLCEKNCIIRKGKANQRKVIIVIIIIVEPSLRKFTELCVCVCVWIVDVVRRWCDGMSLLRVNTEGVDDRHRSTNTHITHFSFSSSTLRIVDICI